jgi:hypothetical protein
MFLRTTEQRQRGDRVEIVLTLPNGRDLHLRGEVRFARPAEGDVGDKPVGMAVRFIDIQRAEDERDLATYIERLRCRAALDEPRETREGPYRRIFLSGRAGAMVASRSPLMEESVSGGISDPKPDYARYEADIELLRRVCWLIAEGSILGRPLVEVFGIPEDAPPESRDAILERLDRVLAPERPPAHLGAEEARAVRRVLDLLRRPLHTD